jgi:DNA-binding LacI/PurR family transcriptional regulator
MGTKKTMRDVAEAAKVSLTVVSRVANGSGAVSPEVQDRVRKAAQRLGIELIRGNKPKIVAFVLSNRDMLHPFHSRVLVGAQKYCAAHSWDMLFLSFGYLPSLPADKLHLPLILQRRDIVRAAILAGTNSQNLLEALTQRGLPFAVYGNSVRGKWQPEKYDVVWTDNIGSAYDITRYLQSIGHRDIWYVGNCQLPWFARSYSGYRRAMEEAGLLSRLAEQISENPEEIGYLATKSILARREPVGAIYAGTDATARGVYKALKDCGIRIPDDVSVVGQDDTESTGLQPPLTTVREFPEQVGSYMAEMVLNRIAKSDLKPQLITIPTELVKRESCRPLSADVESAWQERLQGSQEAQLATVSRT